MAGRLEDIVAALATADPERESLWWKGSWIRRREFMAIAEKAAGSLAKAGFREGDRLITLLPNSPAVIALSWACWKLRGAIVPLNLQAGAPAVIRSISRVDPFAVAVPDMPGVPVSQFDALPVPVVRVSPEGDVPSFTGKRPETPDDPADPDIAVIFATSGTTGLPKAVPLSHENLLSNVRAAEEHFLPFDRSTEVILNVLPNFHALGYSTSGLLALLTGSKQALVPNFMPAEKTLEIMRATGVTFLVGVPAMLVLLLSAVDRGAEAPGTLRSVISGGDRFPTNLDERAQRIFGLGVTEGYGLTECSPVVAVNRSVGTRKLGTVGTPLPGFECRICDASGAILPTGSEGVLWVRGPSVTKGYFRDPELTAKKFVDGWFETGDVARLDEDGYVSIIDRATDVIIVGGFNVYPQEVEDVLCSCPGVKEAAVVGEPHSVSGQIVKAFVVPSGPDVTQKELHAYCKEQLAHYKVPRSFEFVDRLPKSALGKVLRRTLRESRSA